MNSKHVFISKLIYFYQIFGEFFIHIKPLILKVFFEDAIYGILFVFDFGLLIPI